MSTRAMASRYTAQPPPNLVSPTGGSGNTGLMALLTGNSPKQLQSQSNAHQVAIQQMMQQHEKDMEDLQNQHAKEIMEKQGELADKLRNNSTVVKAADAAGVSVEEYVKSIMPQASANALKKSQLEGKGMDTNEFVDSLNRGMNAKNLAPEVDNATELAKASKAELGSAINMPIVKGVNDAANSATVQGATQNQTMIPVGGMPDPRNPGQMIGQQPAIMNSMRPGGVSFPVDPRVRDKVLGGGAPPQVNVDPTQTGMQPNQFDLSSFLKAQGQPTGMDIGAGPFNPQVNSDIFGGEGLVSPTGQQNQPLLDFIKMLNSIGGFQGRQ